jgi:hypothetical protein
LSILFDRHDDRHFGGGARVIDGLSAVCGMTPSSAATTSTTMSVALGAAGRASR